MGLRLNRSKDRYEFACIFYPLQKRNMHMISKSFRAGLSTRRALLLQLAWEKFEIWRREVVHCLNPAPVKGSGSTHKLSRPDEDTMPSYSTPEVDCIRCC